MERARDRIPDGATIAERGSVKQKGFFLYSTDDKAEIDRSFRASGNPPDFVISKTRWLLLGLLYAGDARHHVPSLFPLSLPR